MLVRNTAAEARRALVGETHGSDEPHFNVLLKRVLFLLKRASYFITFYDVDPTVKYF